MNRWYALVDHEVIGPFDTLDPWYHEHAGPDWRAEQILAGNPDPWQVARTEFEGGYVSTVFLGLDQSWDKSFPLPLVFETLVFPECHICERSYTWEQAAETHAQVVASLVTPNVIEGNHE